MVSRSFTKLLTRKLSSLLYNFAVCSTKASTSLVTSLALSSCVSRQGGPGGVQGATSLHVAPLHVDHTLLPQLEDHVKNVFQLQGRAGKPSEGGGALAPSAALGRDSLLAHLLTALLGFV